MKINNQYQEAEAIYPVTGLYIDPEGNAMKKEEMLLSEHRMDVYINDVLTMKLVCTALAPAPAPVLPCVPYVFSSAAAVPAGQGGVRLLCSWRFWRCQGCSS